MKRAVFLCDFQADMKSPIPKAVTGTFGSKVEIKGLIGKLFQYKKRKNVIFPPLYLAYAASIFRKEGWEVEHGHKLKKQTKGGRPFDLILFASSMPGVEDEVAALKNLTNRDQLKVVICGAFAKENPNLYLDVADAVIIDGEPENTFQKIAKGEFDLKSLQGPLKANSPTTLDDLPFPDWSIFNYKKFKYAPMLTGNPLSIITARGCPYDCDYCHYMPEAGPVLRERSLNNVLDEIRYCHDNFDTSSFIFRDLVFTIKRNRTIELCEKIKKLDFSISFAIETRLDKLDEELISLMKEAGLKHMNLGIESPREDLLADVGRKAIPLEHQEKIIKFAHDQGITISAFYILGLTNDTPQSIESTIRYSKQLNTLAAQFCLMTPFPGTKLYDTLKDKLITNKWSNFTQFHPTVKLDNLSNDQLVSYRDLAYKEYYTNPKWLLKHWKRLI